MESQEMSLEKAVQHGKEKRKQYHDGVRDQSRGNCKSFAWACRNHGSCSRCVGSRTHSSRKREFAADEQIEERIENEIKTVIIS